MQIATDASSLLETATTEKTNPIKNIINSGTKTIAFEGNHPFKLKNSENEAIYTYVDPGCLVAAGE